MQPFDDLLPAEMDRQNKEIFAFLRRSYDIPDVIASEPEPQQKELALAAVRQRLFEAWQAELATGSECQPAPHLLAHADFAEAVTQSVRPPEKAVRRRGFQRSIALIAAVLCVALLVGSLLAVQSLAKQSAQNQKSGNQGGTKVVAQALYVYKGGWVQKVNAETGQLQWQYQTPGLASTNYGANLVVSKGVVYVTVEKSLFALRTNDGGLLWHVHLDNYPLAVRPVVQDNTIYLALSLTDHSSAVEAFNLSSGSRLWQSPIDGQISDLQESNHVVYGAFAQTNAGNYLFALRAVNGSQAWQIQIAGWSGHIAIADGRLYTGEVIMSSNESESRWYVYAYNISQGALLWRSVAMPGPSLSQPIAVQHALYMVDMNGLYSFDPQNGHMLWKHTGAVYPLILMQTEPALDFASSVAIQADRITILELASTYHHTLVQLNARNGQLLARHQIENFDDLHFVPSLPTTKSQATPTGAISISELASWIVATDASYVITPDGHLDALSNQTGARLWSVKIMGPAVPATLILAN